MPSSEEVNAQIRASLGRSPKSKAILTFPQEGHIAEFPLWSFSKRRSKETRLHIDYDDGSFCTITAPLGFPSPSFCGYLDAILCSGQYDLFEQAYVEISVYQLFNTLEIDPKQGENYKAFHRDMERAFTLFVKTDRFFDPVTKTRSHIDYFRILSSMKLAKRHEGVSRFHFDAVFLASLRSKYLTRLDFDFCIDLDKRGEALGRFLLGHIMKRIGRKSIYQRRFLGFITDVGLGHLFELAPRNRNQQLKQTLYPALEGIKGHAFQEWGIDDRQNIFFIP